MMERELDHGNVLETNQGTFVVVGVQEVTDASSGETKHFNYLITKPENLVQEEETEEGEDE